MDEPIDAHLEELEVRRVNSERILELAERLRVAAEKRDVVEAVHLAAGVTYLLAMNVALDVDRDRILALCAECELEVRGLSG